MASFSKKQNLRDDVINELYKCMKCEIKKPGESIVKYGEKGTAFYIILSGKVSVRIPVEYSQEMRIFDYEKFVKETGEENFSV